MGKVLSIAEKKAKINAEAAANRHEHYCSMTGSEIARLHPLKMAEAIECLKAEIAKPKKTAKKKATK